MPAGRFFTWTTIGRDDGPDVAGGVGRLNAVHRLRAAAELRAASPCAPSTASVCTETPFLRSA